MGYDFSFSFLGVFTDAPLDLKPQSRRCLFTLHGHLDYVRSVQFHHEMPWIVCCLSLLLFTSR